MTLQEFANKLERLYQDGRVDNKNTLKAGCALPFNLWAEAEKVAELLPQYKVKVKESVLGVEVEITR